MWIVLSGLPAVGKSTLADALGRGLHLPVLSVDSIESAMLRAGIAASFETGFAAYLVVEALTDAQLGRGEGAIVDAVNGVDYAKDMWRQLGARHGNAPRVIECVCSDPAVHRARLAARQRGLPATFREPTWEDVERRRSEHTAWAEPALVVDSIAPLESNVRRAMEWLSRA